MSVEDPAERHPLFDFVVEEVTKEDGRYLLYYRWPERFPEGGDRAAAEEPALEPDAGV